MNKRILLMEVDGPDTIPIGVFATPADARDHILAKHKAGWDRYPDEKEFYWAEEREMFLERYNAAFPEGETLPTEFDVQFESGMGSYDYRFTPIAVY